MLSELGEAQIMHKGFHLRCCKGPVSSSHGAPTLSLSKKIKVTVFLCFYYLSTKIKSMTMLPATFYKSFYLSAMVATFLGTVMVHLFKTPDLPLIFVKLRYF